MANETAPIRSVLFGRADITRRRYVIFGLILALLKYAGDVTILFVALGRFVTPVVYFSPLGELGLDPAHQLPQATVYALVIWTLPFAWAGTSMSIRRARDGAMRPWIGLLFLVPQVNYLLIVALLVVGTREPIVRRREPVADGTPLPAEVRLGEGRFLGVTTLAAVVGAVLIFISANVLEDYGGALFVGTPILISALATFGISRGRHIQPSFVACFGAAILAMTGTGLILFAVGLEGALCLLGMLPLGFILAPIGVFLGEGLSDALGPVTLALVVPGLMVLEPLPPAVPHAVTSTVVIDAPPEVVWQQVIAFPDIEAEPELIFRAGVAMPLRAHIEGEGVGAVRHCEFTTGAFVEPITVWDAPHHLAFDVRSQPPPMDEMSPYDEVDAPHLLSSLRSQRGEFRLVALPGGRTRLEGTTWYTLEMAPNLYWGLMSDQIIHTIHGRVLEHIKRESEGWPRSAERRAH